MGDDDTVFFTENLVSVLAKYDHRQVYYIGANSESVEQDVMHSYGMAFGGGGFAVSYGLAAKLATMLDGCLDRYYRFYGSDQRIWACVSEIGVSLTTERGFHQVRQFVDPFYSFLHVAAYQGGRFKIYAAHLTVSAGGFVVECPFAAWLCMF